MKIDEGLGETLLGLLARRGEAEARSAQRKVACTRTSQGLVSLL